MGVGSYDGWSWSMVLAIGALVLSGNVVAREVRAAEPEGRIVVFSEATVEDKVIRLADVARLEGVPAKELAALELGRASAPGTVRTLPGAMILGALRGYGVDFDRIRYVIPPVVRVRRRTQEISAATIRAIVDSYLDTQLDRADGRVVVRGVEVPGGVRLAPGPYRSRITRRLGAPLAGRTQVQVNFLQDERVAGSVPVTVHIAVFENVYVTRRAIPRGAVLTAEDISTERRDVSTLPRGLVTREEEVVGKEAKVALPPLMPLRHEQLGAPVLVRRGEVVTLLAESQGLRVTTNGEVREDAPRGGQVRVLNRSSQKEVVGRVMNATTVAVAF